MSCPHPSGEGRGRLESLLGMLVIMPTSLNRGEGQMVGCRFMARGIVEEGGGGVVVVDEPKINHRSS